MSGKSRYLCQRVPTHKRYKNQANLLKCFTQSLVLSCALLCHLTAPTSFYQWICLCLWMNDKEIYKLMFFLCWPGLQGKANTAWQKESIRLTVHLFSLSLFRQQKIVRQFVSFKDRPPNQVISSLFYSPLDFRKYRWNCSFLLLLR